MCSMLMFNISAYRPNTACTGWGYAPRFRRRLARFGAIMAAALLVPPTSG
jgi:hypothetical protein